MSRSSRTELAVLGLVAMGPKSGYDIKKEVEAQLSHFWSESFGNLYPVLKRLTDHDLLVRKADPDAGGRDRFVYSLTDDGRRALADAFVEPAALPQPRNELMLRVFFGEFADPAHLLRDRRAAPLRAGGARGIVGRARPRSLLEPHRPLWRPRHAGDRRVVRRSRSGAGRAGVRSALPPGPTRVALSLVVVALATACQTALARGAPAQQGPGQGVAVDSAAVTGYPERFRTPAPRTSHVAVDPIAVTAYVERFVRAARMPSAAVTIATSEGTAYARAFGGLPGAVPSDTSRWYLGSNTKPITATVVMTQVDDGLVELDAPVSRYLPGLGLRGAEGITVRHLLEHSSGLSTRSAFDRRVQREGRLDHVRPVRSPGEAFDYSSLNYLVLGMIIEAVSGQEYEAELRRRVLEPLGMTRTSSRPFPSVPGFSYAFPWLVERGPPRHTRLMIPAGYLASTPQDVGRFLSVILGSGAIGDRRLLSEEIASEMLTPSSGAATGPALGWGVGRRAGRKIYTHSGMTPGSYAQFAVLPESDLAVAVLVGRNAGPLWPAPGELMEGVLTLLEGRVPEPYSGKERWLRWAILAALVHAVGSAAWTAARWWRAGRQRAVSGALRPLLLRLGVLAASVWLVLHVLAEITLAGLLEFYPDLGMLLVAAIVLGVPEAVLKAAVSAARTPA